MTTPDPSRRFRTAAAHYLAGRPPYGEKLIRRVVELTGLQPQHAVLDLGCGPGTLTRAFAPFAARVLGLDPEPEMLRVAADAGTPANVGWQAGSSATLAPDLGRFHFVTMGRSFHWMDRVDTLRRLDGLVEPGGAIALFDDSHPDFPGNAQHRGYRAILARYNSDDPARSASVPRHGAVLLDSAFSEIEGITVYSHNEMPATVLIDRALSMSSTSRARLGARADDLLRELGAWLTTAAPDGIFREVLATSALIARRPR
jgi:SAM-dependent methyltransferase